MTVSRALLSVSDKSGLLELARGLAALGVELLSTGGTAAQLQGEGVAVKQVQDFTGAPEMLGGRVKTLHPKIHGGILARRESPSDQQEMKAHGVLPIDLVVVNLYPFREAVAKGLPAEEIIEQIDIGGPSMLRSAAKNAAHVAVVVDPADYPIVLAELRERGEVSARTRARLQARAFAHTAAYDAAIAAWLSAREAVEDTWPPGHAAGAAHAARDEVFAEVPPLGEFKRVQALRYGENPHQAAAFYAAVPQPREPTLAMARQIQGKELSYNNLLDASAALEAVKDHAGGKDAPAAVVIVKHTNPCGVALAKTVAAAYLLAREADPISAFGGIVALSHPVDEAAGELLAQTFLEAVIAPGFNEGARRALAGKKSLRLLELPLLGEPRGGWLSERRELRSVPGGLLVQTRDLLTADPARWNVVTRRAPTLEELSTLGFAWSVVKHVKSNAIVLARGASGEHGRMLVTAGVGMGQTNRVDSVRIATGRAGAHAKGAALASDAFFPFPDGVEAAAEAGVACIAQPGGSVRDAEVIAAADARGVAMVFTGARHFRH